jgi:acetyltransferase-like isoleucine patch superfamily enzyme
MASALAYFGYGLGLLVIVPVVRWVTLSLGTPLGTYPYVSRRGYQWASYNALILMVRFSFINWIRATPFNVFFYRLMGMKVGARTQINTAVVADCNLITIGADTVVGGDVTLIAHAVEGPNLVTARVKIGDRVTIGLMAVIMPGCEIGDGAILAANAVLKKGTTIGPGEIWGGVPAKRLGARGQKSAVEAPVAALP